MTWTQLKRILNPNTNPTLIPALAALAYSVWQGEQVASHNGPLTWQGVIKVAAGVVMAAALKYVVRAKVTPVADPKNASGQPMVTGEIADISMQLAKLQAAVAVQPPRVVVANPPVTTTGAGK